MSFLCNQEVIDTIVINELKDFRKLLKKQVRKLKDIKNIRELKDFETEDLKYDKKVIKSINTVLECYGVK